MAILITAKNEAQRKAASNPTPDNIRALGLIDKAIGDLERLSMNKEGESVIFDNLIVVKDYLDKEGWQVSQSGVYKHKKEGKLLPVADGTYRQKDVDKYARTWLKLKSTGKKKQDKLDELQRQKLELEQKKLQIETDRAQLKFEIEKGKYIEKERMFLEMAARAGILDAGLNHWIHTGAAEWIRLVDGDLKKISDLIATMNTGKDELLNHYARMREFQVIFDDDVIEDDVEA